MSVQPAGSTAQQIARYLLITALLILGGWMLRHFLPALCWAVVLAIATAKVYARWLARFSGHQREFWAALTFTTIVGIVLIAPLVYGALVAGREAFALARSLTETQGTAPELPPWLVELPYVGDWVQSTWSGWFDHSAIEGVGSAAPARPELFSWTRIVGIQVLKRASTLAFTLLTLFFVYLYRDNLRDSLMRVSQRIFGPNILPLLEHVDEAIRATVDGVVLVAVVEGVIMGVVYQFAHAPHPVLFGALTAVAAMIPFAAPVVFGAVALILAAAGALAAGIVVAVIGTVVLFIADHFVRPYIIGGGARLPFLWVLLGILGGVESFGLVGIFLGPALMAALVALWREWASHER